MNHLRKLLAGTVLFLSVTPCLGATNALDSAEWRNVSGFPDKYKVLYSGHATKTSGTTAFMNPVQFYWVDTSGVASWDSDVQGSVPASDINRFNYGSAYTTGFKSGSPWRCRTKVTIFTTSGNQDVWSSITTPAN